MAAAGVRFVDTHVSSAGRAEKSIDGYHYFDRETEALDVAAALDPRPAVLQCALAVAARSRRAVTGRRRARRPRGSKSASAIRWRGRRRTCCSTPSATRHNAGRRSGAGSHTARAHGLPVV